MVRGQWALILEAMSAFPLSETCVQKLVWFKLAMGVCAGVGAAPVKHTRVSAIVTRCCDCPAAAISHCLRNAFAIWYIVATSAEGRLGMRWLPGWSLGVGGPGMKAHKPIGQEHTTHTRCVRAWIVWCDAITR